MTTIEEATLSQATAEPPEVREAVLRPFVKAGRGFWLLATLLAAIVAAGLAAWVIQLNSGLGAAGYNDQAFWAVYEADLVTFIGVSYGGAVISAILRLTGAQWRAPLTRLAEGTAVVTVLIGGAFVIPHLGHVQQAWELVTRPNLSSPIFWDFVAVATYTAGSIVFFVLPLVPDTAIVRGGYGELLGRRNRLYRAISGGWSGTPRQRRVLQGSLGLISIMIIPLAVSVHSVLSWAFALVSRPWWHESIWAPYFVVAALYSGVALVVLVVAGFRRAYHLEAFITERHFRRLGFILAAFAAAYLYLTFADILPGAYVGEPDTAAVFHALLLGHFSAYFWIFVVGGGIIPLLLIAIRRTRTTAGIITAAAFIVPAMWLKRILMVTDPATYNRVSGAFGTFHFTWIPVTVTLAGLAAIPLLLMLMFRIVPLLSIDEMEQAAAAERGAGQLAASAPSPVRSAAIPVTVAQAVAAPEAVPAPASGVLAAPARRRHRLAWFSRATRVSGAMVLLAAGAGFLALHSAASASAATHKPAAATVTISGTETGVVLHLTATVSGPGNLPLAKTRVRFFQLTTEFGPQGQLVPIGTATTGKTGTAKLAYRPTVAGPQKFVAKYAGSASAGAATAKTTVNITSAQSAYRPAAPKPLAGLGKITVGVLLMIVALIWLTLAAQVVRVRRACRAGAT
jgi:Ni/Fe-hydrogenase subunit HybB-like protein